MHGALVLPSEALSELRHPLVLWLLLSHEGNTNSLSCYQS